MQQLPVLRVQNAKAYARYEYSDNDTEDQQSQSACSCHTCIVGAEAWLGQMSLPVNACLALAPYCVWCYALVEPELEKL